MKQTLTLLLLSVYSGFTFGQNREKIKSGYSFFPKERAKVLVVGTFHFHYPGLDAFKSEDKNKIDVLKEPKKTEVTELVNYIKKFKPTKIAIEAFPEWQANERFKKYKKGEYRGERDERYQLAMRIADEMQLDSIYSIDAHSMDEDLAKIDSNYIARLSKDYDFFKSEDKYLQYYINLLNYYDRLPATTPLLDYFKYINSRESHQLGFGAYLIGDYKLDNARGADLLSIWWYNRNLRIFRKLQEITAGSKDRILVVFGNGHASILRQLLESSPEYEFVEFDSLK
ncbi:MAG: DUF5694 domain-containing protein [Spirosomataceae bacterium]